MAKRRYKKKAIPVRIGQQPTKERHQHNGGMIAETVDRDASGKAILKRYKAIAECVLDSYFIREIISEAEYEAGMRFRKAYLRAVLHVRVDDVGAGSHHDPEMSIHTVMLSEQLIRQAYSVFDLTEQAVIITVCGHDDWAGGAHRMKAFHTGMAKLIELWNIS